MDNYYYKLVCVDETNPMGYRVLNDENFDSLDAVHEFVQRHINEYIPNLVKWMLMPFKKDEVRVKELA